MTNNPTIDGVSRELLELSAQCLTNSGYDAAFEELRALLDAPAVERQEPAGYVLAKQSAVDVPGQERKELGYTLLDSIGVFSSREEVHAAITELGLPIGWVSMTVEQLLPGYMMTNNEVSEVAALQSAIAQLKDEVGAAKGEYDRSALADKNYTMGADECIAIIQEVARLDATAALNEERK